MAKRFKEQWYIDPYFVASDGIGAIVVDHVIAPLTVASFGFLALQLVAVRRGGGSEAPASIPLPDIWKWKPIQRAPEKTLDEIKEILRRHLNNTEVEEIETVSSEEELNTITNKINDPIDIVQIRTLIRNILLQEPDTDIIELDLRNISEVKLKSKHKKIVAKYLEKKISTELFKITAYKKKKKIRVKPVNITKTPRIKITILDKEIKK